MRSVIESIFGEYQPIVTDVYNDVGEFIGTTVVSGAAGVDWTYVLGVIGFFIVLYSFFRLVGVFFK